MTHALQVYLEDADFRALQSWAAERGWTLSQAVRTALKALTRSPRGEDPLLAGSGMIEGLPYDLSARFDDYLASTFVAEPITPYGPKRRRKPRSGKAVHR
ncbi:MAG: hypothetical protein HYZ28_28345 [Myxococcales bacterium]|nr:hypothetical protein [Myxococcales bacterium]